MKEIIGSQVYKGKAEYGIYAINENRIEFFEGQVQHTDERINLNNILGLQGNQSLCFLSWDDYKSPNETDGINLGHTQYGDLALIFQGRVTNLAELREFLQFRGHPASAKTEAEVMAILINENLKSGDYNLKDSISTALSLVEGEYAVIAMAVSDPESLVAAMSNKPLAIGRGQEDYLVSNQSRVLLDQTKNVTYLNNNEIAYINMKQQISIESLNQCGEIQELPGVRKHREEDNPEHIAEKPSRRRAWPMPVISSGGNGRWLPRSLAGLTVKAIAFQLLVLYLVSVTADFAGKMVFFEMGAAETIALL